MPTTGKAKSTSVDLLCCPEKNYSLKDGIGVKWIYAGTWDYKPMDDAFNKPWQDWRDQLRAAGYVVRIVFKDHEA